MRNKRVMSVCAVVAALFVASPGHCCDIPVYRYALANWAPDAYQVFVFLDGTGQDGGRLGQMREQTGKDANVVVTEVDVAKQMDPFAASVWNAQEGAKTPWVVVRNPMPLPPRVSVWSGALESLDVSGLVNSQARSAIAKRLQEDALGVWVLLECGDKEKDEKALNTLREALEEADEATTERLGDKKAAGAPPMADCVVTVARTDAAESFLVESLLATESDLRAYDEPMVFPVYGRGRVLYALIGAGINRDTVVETALFLAGDCSCEVKDDNPGVDLLMTADWGELGVAPTATGYREIALPKLD